ncbi:MAG: glycosyltransferase family 39 protein [Anaerolineae bacterium]|nr:glycosyltransferase family 39 protein [Anaerolineae bacterium]
MKHRLRPMKHGLRPMKHGQRWGAYLLLLVCFAQLLNAATQLSATVDEGFHITSGYEYLRTGKLQLFDEHSPLAKAIFAWPLFFVPDLTPPEQAPGYAEGDLIAAAQATFLSYQPIDRLIVACRVPVTLLTLLLAATVYRWAARSFGKNNGLLALILFVFDPNLLAHGSLATTDMGAIAFIFWASFALYAYLHTPTRWQWLTVALFLGLAQAAKLTAALLLPIGGLILVIQALNRNGTNSTTRDIVHSLLHATLSYAGMMTIAGLILWALYGFEVRPLPEIANGTFPLPAASHIERILRLRANLDYGREAFLLGQNQMHGWWSYFPIAFLIKTPLATLLITLFILLRLTFDVLHYLLYKLRMANYEWRITNYEWRMANGEWRITNGEWRMANLKPLLPLILFPALYAIASLTSTLNIGYRHLLPILPFLYVLVAETMMQGSRGAEEQGSRGAREQGEIERRDPRLPHPPKSRFTHYVSRITFYALLLLQILPTLLVSPHYLSFFNALIGGPRNGWRYLADSNTDWGQGYRALAQFQSESENDELRITNQKPQMVPQSHSQNSVKLAAFTFYDPALYGVQYTPLTPLGGDTPPVFPSRLAPPPGKYVISVTSLDGVPLADPDMYDWFRWRVPDARIADALHYYAITPEETATTWVAQCTTPAAPLDTATITEGFGSDTLRRVDFDCTQAWIIPGGGSTPGGYLLHGALLNDTLAARLHYAPPSINDSFIARNLEMTRMAYRQREDRAIPTFALYRFEAQTVTAPQTAHWVAAAGTHPPFPEQALQHTSQPLEGPLTFLGYHTTAVTSALEEPYLEVETWWQVTEGPIERPLSLMAHLLTLSGEMIGGADGLGISPSVWQQGDMIVQRHRFTLPATANTYLLRAGAYWLDDSSRWQIAADPAGADAIFIPIRL